MVGRAHHPPENVGRVAARDAREGSLGETAEGSEESSGSRHPIDPGTPLEAHSPAMQAVVRRAEGVARTSAPVILLGETGTGKEVLARTIHRLSTRAARPFVPVNCGAIPGELLESELFGHVRGSFSGAVADKAGLFQTAAGGTLLLDEVADLPVPLQVKLLRVLQGGEVRRLGSNRSQVIDVRVIAATHKDLDALVRSGSFRADLYFRLKVFSLKLPPLRERIEDVLPLARWFLRMERLPAPRLSPAVATTLEAYGWPGNVRELFNAMRYAAAVAEGEVIELEHLPEEIPGAATSAGRRPALRTLADREREHILSVLDACRGVRSLAARFLGISRNTLGRKLQAYGMPSAADPETGALRASADVAAALDGDGPGDDPGEAGPDL